ncbi:VOC family protein [Brachybacterium sp. DNPG3]
MSTAQNAPAPLPLSIHSSFLPHTDPEASLAFYRDVLGLEVRLDVGGGPMRWITVGPVGQDDTAIVLHPVLAGNGLTEEEHATLLAIIAKGAYFGVNLAAADLDATFAALEAAGAEIVQEPIDQAYGVRDIAVRDPAGNLLRIQQARP